MNNLFFMAKNKKACRFNHFRRKCISSDTKWLDIINAEHCVSSNRRKWYERPCRDDILAKGEMISSLKGLMICQTYGLDTKKSYQNDTTFLDIGCILEPPTKFGCRSRTLTNIRKSDQNLRQKDLKSN